MARPADEKGVAVFEPSPPSVAGKSLPQQRNQIGGGEAGEQQLLPVIVLLKSVFAGRNGCVSSHHFGEGLIGHRLT
jgi:hypothetical protein